MEPLGARRLRSKRLFEDCVPRGCAKMLSPLTLSSVSRRSVPLCSVHGYARVHTSLYKNSVRVLGGPGAFFGASCLLCSKTLLFTAREPLGAQKGCSGLLRCHRGARKGRSSLLLSHRGAQNYCSSVRLPLGRSTSLFELASEPLGRSKSLFEHASAPLRCAM